VGNTLDGKLEYTIDTPQYHVVPGSGFPTDNQRIGGCDKFTIRFSNKYDMSPENVAKIQIYRITEDGQYLDREGGPCNGTGPCVPVAGGQLCAETIEEMDATGLPPCLRVDIENQGIGELNVQVDPAEFGPVLKTGSRYRLYVHGLQSIEEMSDPALYAAAFWDACGMPLIIGGASDFLYDFSIDPPKCKEDEDQDTVSQSCDNADKFFNPEQGDIDRDSVGDVIDLCPTVPTSTANSADSDRDGVGNECDTCRQTVKQYNEEDALPPGIMRVRNIPHQQDTDGDGIGDVCDNCVTVANCESYGPGNRWQLGDPIAFDDRNICQTDNDRDMVGDRCAPSGPNDFDPAVAAGPIGILDDDDFDQDGLSNRDDGCPRQPLPERIECVTDDDCPATSRCSPNWGICNHADQDGDEIGDICDSCVADPNSMQNVDGLAQEQDDDGDFVGLECETHSGCANRADPRPFSFYAVSVGGSCCTTALATDPMTGDVVNARTGIPLLDPDRVPIRRECSQAEQDADPPICRALTSSVVARPGVIELPSGCEEALTDVFDNADPANNVLLTPDDFDGDLQALWDTMCFLPQRDQDYDGLGDSCDLCPFDFDPENKPFVDANGKLWSKDGFFCHGDYDIENKCEEAQPSDTEGTGTGGTGDTGDTGDDLGTGTGMGTGGGGTG
jgi:hypothetical protein